MNSGSNTALKVLKPIVSLAGLIGIILSFVKIDVLFYDSGYMGVFRLISSLSDMDIFESDEITDAKIIIIAIFAVIALLSIVGGLTSLLDSSAGKSVPIVCSALNIVVSLGVIIFCIVVNSDEELYGLAAINPGIGFYLLIFFGIIMIVLSAVTPSNSKQNNLQGGYNNYGNQYGNYNNQHYANNFQSSNNYNPAGYSDGGYNTDAIPLTKRTPASENKQGVIRAVSGEYTGFEFPILNSEIIHIGRNAANNAIVITEDNKYISGNHCAVKFENNSYFVMDYSTNGTIVNGSPIKKSVWVPVVMGSKICLYDESNTFTVG